MPKAKTVNKRNFNNLTSEQQVKELKRMAKRANVRASLLEESGVLNKAYQNAEEYNKSLGKTKNRFYEGTKYQTKGQIQDAFTAISNFLNNKTSTLGGVKTEVEQKIDKLIKQGKFDYETLKAMSTKEKIYAGNKMANIANKRLTELEKSGIDYYAYAKAQHYNNATGRNKNRFYRGSKFKTERDLDIHLQNEADFLNAESSTAKGVANIHERRVDTFRKNGLDIPQGKEKEFYNFLTSEQFTSLKKYADSNQTLSTFVEARKKNVDIKDIEKAYQRFMNGEIEEDDVQEILKTAKWKQGGLLK